MEYKNKAIIKKKDLRRKIIKKLSRKPKTTFY